MQPNCKRENETYVTMSGVITQDKYDKSRYRWDPQLKKVVYTRVNKQSNEGTAEANPKVAEKNDKVSENKFSDKDYGNISQLAMEYVNAHNGYKGMSDSEKQTYSNEFKNSMAKAIKENSYEPVMPFVQNLMNLAKDDIQYEYDNIAVTPERKEMAKKYLKQIKEMIGKGTGEVERYSRREARID